MPKCSSSGGWRLDPRPLARLLLLALSTLDGHGLWWDRGIRALAEARKLPDIHWHSNNSIFDISNTEHVKRVQLMDRVTLLCPPPEADGDPASRYEHTKLFMVFRDAYQQCALHGDERQLGVCSTPERQSSITLVFRQFSPLPSAFTFRPGHSYFVITTSNGSMSGLNSTRGGLCSTRNMRLKFDILPSESDENESAQALEQHRHHGHSHSHGRLPPHHRKSSRREPEEQQQLEASQEEMAAAVNDGHPPFLYVIHTADTPLGEEEEDEQQQSAAWEQRVEGRGSRQRHLAAQAASSSLRHFPASAISVLPVLSLLAALFQLGRLLGPQ